MAAVRQTPDDSYSSPAATAGGSYASSVGHASPVAIAGDSYASSVGHASPVAIAGDGHSSCVRHGSPGATAGESPSSSFCDAPEGIPLFFPTFPRGSAVLSTPTKLASPDAAGVAVVRQTSDESHSSVGHASPGATAGESWSVRHTSPGATAGEYQSSSVGHASPEDATELSRQVCPVITTESFVLPMTMAGASPPFQCPQPFPAGYRFPVAESSTSAAAFDNSIRRLPKPIIPVSRGAVLPIVPRGSAVPAAPTMPAVPADGLQDGVYIGGDVLVALLAFFMVAVISFVRYALGFVRLFRD